MTAAYQNTVPTAQSWHWATSESLAPPPLSVPYSVAVNVRFSLGLALIVLAATWWLTLKVRRYAEARQLLDVPNARSSHVVATPRGGGVAIVLTTVLAFPVLGAFGTLAWPAVAALVGGGGLVAVIGFADDHQDIPARWRLLGHFAAAVWVLAWIGGLPPLPMLGTVLDLGPVGHGLAVLYLVWLLNLTNFMDGIDGIAGVETVTVSLGGALLYWAAAPSSTQWVAPVVLASATLGFLFWNWAPAKIFMGDAGSGFLGLMLAAFSLQAARVQPGLFWGWVILLAVFIVDATVTLVRRVARGERFDQAHKSHAYQQAARRWGAHQPVTLVVGAINIAWLLPWALLVSLDRVDALAGVCIAYAPLVAVVVWLRAGKPA